MDAAAKSDEGGFFCGIGNPFCTGCLSVWCQVCRELETEALVAVHRILDRVDYAFSLFPSSRILTLCYPKFGSDEFAIKHKSLCLWLNIVSWLRLVIDQVGKRLGCSNTYLIPWPHFSPVSAQMHSPACSNTSKDSGNFCLNNPSEQTNFSCTLSGNKQNKPKLKINRSPVVKFDFDFEYSSPIAGNTPDSADLTVDSFCSGVSSDSSGSSGRKSSNHLSPPVNNYILRRCCSDTFLEANPVRKYVENLLRNKGMKKTLFKVTDFMKEVFRRIFMIIEASQGQLNPVELTKSEVEGKATPPSRVAFYDELVSHDGWTKRFSSYGLPNFHTLALFLSSVPLHMMRECLIIRLSQQPQRPSCLSIRYLMSEYKEVIKYTIFTRRRFSYWCDVLVSDLPFTLASNLESRKTRAVEELDSNTGKLIQMYLKWLDQLILMMHSETHVAGLQRDTLQEEWCFIQSVSLNFTEGESMAVTQFCNIANHMLSSARDFVDTVLDDVVSDIQSSSVDSPREDVDKMDSPDANEFLPIHDSEMFDQALQTFNATSSKNDLVSRCRRLNNALRESRERSLRAIDLAKMLKSDLEIAFEGSFLLENPERVLKSFFKHNYILVKCNFLSKICIFVPDSLERCPQEILSILEMRKSGSLASQFVFLVGDVSTKFGAYKGKSMCLDMSAECAIALSRVQIKDVMVIVKDGLKSPALRTFLSVQFKGIIGFENDLIAPQNGIKQNLLAIKKEAIQLCKCLGNLKSIVSLFTAMCQIDVSASGPDQTTALPPLVKETLNRAFVFGFECHKEVLRLVCNGSLKSQLVPIMINFAKLWMEFVPQNYSMGKGCRPRWASPGLEFFTLICDSHNLKYLSRDEFENFLEEVEWCRYYIVGSECSGSPCSPLTSPISLPKRFKSQSSSGSLTNLDGESPQNCPSKSYFQITRQEIDSTDPEARLFEGRPPIERVRSSVSELEKRLEIARVNQKVIGKVTTILRDHVEIKPYTVPFSWHRGFKIGSGTFGKVYTAINNSTGEIMALKIMQIQPNDRRSVQKVVNELTIFEKIDHPHLVRYFGVEIHSDEMLMFMEYCDEGTLDALSYNSDGLPEVICRRYTQQLLLAVHKLHENGIVHRDIKGANIFLAQEASILKLGDFGCAVRLRGYITEANEFSGIVGTHAFMAPEIFLSNEGHGRAADVWSVGCVIVEMLVGKRPWSQYDSGVQIMFQVGCGASPDVPSSLSEEGRDFVDRCFVHLPKERSTAAELLDHPFLKVGEEDISSLSLFSDCRKISFLTNHCSKSRPDKRQ